MAIFETYLATQPKSLPLKIYVSDEVLSSTHALVAQWIEHQLAELGVGGSNPLERAISFSL